MTDIADKIYAATGLTLNADAAAKVGQMIQQAKRDALEEAARWHDEQAKRWQNTYVKETLSGLDMQAARVMCLEHGGFHIDSAAAIRALSDTPPDMVLVPREPTPAMIKACLQAALDFMAETKTTEVHPGQTYPSPSENARRCWRAMVKAAGKGEGDE
jgi:glutathione S-transferase